jgi:hypothetical protein
VQLTLQPLQMALLRCEQGLQMSMLPALLNQA